LAAVGQQPGQGAVFSVDPNPAAGAPVVAGSFPRSILIPGTDTSIKIYGQMTEIINYYLTGANPNASPQSSTVGVTGQLESIPLRTAGVTSARQNGVFLQTPRESKFGIETRTPTPFGEARTVVEMDFAGSTTFAPGGGGPLEISDSLVPRVRYAYGTLGGFLAGQATSNFADPDANGETLDFGGNPGEPGKVRIPQVRYTMPAWWGTSLSFSAETPETVLGTGAGIVGSDAGVTPAATTTCTIAALATATTCTTALLTSGPLPTNITKATAPNVTAAWYWPQAWGHFDFSTVLLPGLDVDDGHYFDKQYIGYGGHFGIDVKPGWFGWVKDDIILHVVGGSGMGNYLNASTNFMLETNYGSAGNYGSFNGPTTATSAAAIIVKPVTVYGGEIGYQHWWLDNLRSNFNAGINKIDINANVINNIGISGTATAYGAGQAAADNKELVAAHANLIWNPVSFVDIGVEYIFGYRQVVNGSNATMSTLESKLAFRF
jgi:hypothetical protein